MSQNTQIDKPYADRLHNLATTEPVGLETALQAILLFKYNGDIISYAIALMQYINPPDRTSVIEWAQTYYPLTDPHEREYVQSNEFQKFIEAESIHNIDETAALLWQSLERQQDRTYWLRNLTEKISGVARNMEELHNWLHNKVF